MTSSAEVTDRPGPVVEVNRAVAHGRAFGPDAGLTVLDALLRGQEAEFEGEVFRVKELKGYPRPRQGPRPPIAVGGGGPRMLALAAKHADVISVAPGTTPDGKMKLSDMTIEKTAERVDQPVAVGLVDVRRHGAAAHRGDRVHVIDVAVGEEDRRRAQPVLVEDLAQGLLDADARVDDDALLPLVGGQDVAVGPERGGGEGDGEHRRRLPITAPGPRSRYRRPHPRADPARGRGPPTTKA